MGDSMKEWYLIKGQPTFNGGTETDDFDYYTSDGFEEALESPLGEDVIFCNGQYDGETGMFNEEYTTRAIIQNKTFDAYTQGWKRQALTRITDLVANYKYIKVKDTLGNWQIYIIMTMPDSNKIYTKVVIHECNYILKWQDSETGTIYYYPSHTVDATQYNTGVEYQGNVIQTGYIQLMSWISLDDVTVELQRDKRMFIDYSKKHPDAYVITSTSKVPYSYNEMRIMRITFTETEVNPDVDRIDLMLCDYIDPNNIPQPTTPIVISYAGKPELRMGGRKTFTAETNDPVVFSLVCSSIYEGKITMTHNGNKCTVKCENDRDLVGATFKIKATSDTQNSELLVNIIGAV